MTARLAELKNDLRAWVRRRLDRQPRRQDNVESVCPPEGGAYEAIGRMNLRPVEMGTVYSPDGKGWMFYPEEDLLVGLTGEGTCRTNVRSVLAFPLPAMSPDAVLLEAILRLRVKRNEPAESWKHLCLRAIPTGIHTPWTVAQEMSQPVLAEHHLATEVDRELDFDLTGQVESWLSGRPNRGVLLDFGASDTGLVAFAGRSDPDGPVLQCAYINSDGAGPAMAISVGPDATADSSEFPCGDLVVKNLGPGLSWITPLYRFAHDPPVDPAGIPLAVLEPGAYLRIQPKVPATWLLVRVGTALTGTTVMVIPLYPSGQE